MTATGWRVVLPLADAGSSVWTLAATPEMPAGSSVLAWPATRDERALVTRTVGPPWLLGGHTWVVRVAGYSGGIALSHIEVLPLAETGQTGVGSEDNPNERIHP